MSQHAQGSPARRLRRTALLGAGALLLGGLPVLAVALPASAAVPGQVSGAVQTTDVTGGAVNENHYAFKTDVYLSGGPNTDHAHFLAAGDYFFAILLPGGQSNPNDGGQGNLSSPWDTAADRTFTADGAGGAVQLIGTHTISAAKVIQTAPFDDTTNAGGVYVAAVCQYVATPGSEPTAQTVDPRDCKYDAFKVDEGTPVTHQDAPTAEKSAVATHSRDVHWTIAKAVKDSYGNDANGQTYLGSPKTVYYSVTATKSATDTFGVTGSITVFNSNFTSLQVTVTEDGLDPTTTDTCTLAASGSLLVPAKDALTGDPGQNSVDYACTFDPNPDTKNLDDTDKYYANAATVTYDLGEGAGNQDLPVSSDPFKFPAPTYVTGHDPETISVTDAFNGGAAAALSPATASDTYTWNYSRTLSNFDCHTYPNTATIVENGQTASTSVTVCGPNSGGLTMGWWQNKNGQTLLKANLGPTPATAACPTVNSYLPLTFTHGANSYLPDAYTSAKLPLATYSYNSGECTGPTGSKSYLPTFDLNVFSVAAAAGTGTKMVEGQWLTTALNTATYTVSTSAGKPTLNAGTKVVIPVALRGATSLDLATCDTIGHLLTNSAGKYGSYATSKTAITSALIPLLTAINQDQAQTCP